MSTKDKQDGVFKILQQMYLQRKQTKKQIIFYFFILVQYIFVFLYITSLTVRWNLAFKQAIMFHFPKRKFFIHATIYYVIYIYSSKNAQNVKYFQLLVCYFLFITVIIIDCNFKSKHLYVCMSMGTLEVNKQYYCHSRQHKMKHRDS